MFYTFKIGQRGSLLPMVSHLSFVKKISNSPDKERTLSGAYQSLEKEKILRSPFQRHTPQPVSQDIALQNHPNTPCPPWMCKPIQPKGHSLMRIHLDFLRNVGDFSLKSLQIHEYLWDRRSLEERFRSLTHLTPNKKSLSIFEFSPLFPQR